MTTTGKNYKVIHEEHPIGIMHAPEDCGICQVRTILNEGIADVIKHIVEEDMKNVEAD